MADSGGNGTNGQLLKRGKNARTDPGGNENMLAETATYLKGPFSRNVETRSRAPWGIDRHLVERGRERTTNLFWSCMSLTCDHRPQSANTVGGICRRESISKDFGRRGGHLQTKHVWVRPVHLSVSEAPVQSGVVLRRSWHPLSFAQYSLIHGLGLARRDPHPESVRG
jgi:hypothetical protein